MRIAVYHEPFGPTLGGAETVTAAVAEVLADCGAVDLVHHRPGVTADEWAAFAGAGLDRVRLRYVSSPTWVRTRWDWSASAAYRRPTAGWSAGYDLFVASTHSPPPFNAARRGAFYLHFPNVDLAAEWPHTLPVGPTPRGLLNWVRRRRHERLWQDRMAGYAVRLVNSRFTAGWTERYWGVRPAVLHPPVDVTPAAGPNGPLVLTVGRFVEMKQHREAATVFRDRVAPAAPGWGLACAGGVGRDPAAQTYLDRVAVAAGSAPVTLHPDLPRPALKQLIARAAVYWHLAGLGTDPAVDPIRQEHFGITTVEAMAAGCVPVVIARGGQPEIVRHGRDGFLCETAAEVADRTLELVRDEPRRQAMSVAARERAAAFGRERFRADLLAHLAPVLAPGAVR